MGNVQCCASGRFHRDKITTKNNKKNKKQAKLKQTSDKTNSVGGGGKDEGVQKVAIVAEEAQGAGGAGGAGDGARAPEPPAGDPPGAEATETDGRPRNESISAARERFFNGQQGNVQALSSVGDYEEVFMKCVKCRIP